MAGKCGILPFELARLFAGGISDYRLRRLIEDETLARKEDGLDADQFFVALAQQEEIRGRSVKAGRREDGDLPLNIHPKAIRAWAGFTPWGGGTGTNVFTITDGKMTGWAASGTGKNVLATGVWAPLSGKTDKWTAKPTAPGQFTVEQKFD